MLFLRSDYLANGVDGYGKAIELALQENDEAKQAERIRFAQSHSWENSVNEIYQAILANDKNQ